MPKESCLKIIPPLLFLISLLHAAPVEQTTRVMMGTFVTIKAPANATAAVQEAFSAMEAVDARFSTYRDDSEVSRLNKAGTIDASPELLHLLEISETLNKKSHGAFDITVGGYTKDLYRFGKEDVRLPSKAALNNASQHVGFTHLHRKGKSVRLDTGTRLDFGGIAKGYAVEKAAERLISHGVSPAIIAAGGDIFCMKQCDIAVTDPFNPERITASFTTALPRMSVSTSGNYRRFVDDPAHSHLLDPASGCSQQQTAGVTLIGREGNTYLDGLATAVTIMEKEAGRALLKKHPDIAYIIFYTDGTSLTSDNLPRLTRDFRRH